MIETISDFVGNWPYTFDNGMKATYEITEDGKVKIIKCVQQCTSSESLLQDSDSKLWSSSQGWRKINNIHEKGNYIYAKSNGKHMLLLTYVQVQNGTGTPEKKCKILNF